MLRCRVYLYGKNLTECNFCVSTVTANLIDLNLSRNYSLHYGSLICMYQYNLLSVKEAPKTICKQQRQNSVLSRITDNIMENYLPFQKVLEVRSIFSIINEIFALITKEMITWHRVALNKLI